MQDQETSTNSNSSPEQLNIADEYLKVEIERIVKPCYQCGTCSGGCPIAKRDPEFNPRRIVHRFLHKRENKTSNSSLWSCLLCHACVERCPQEVKPSHVIVALRNRAIREGEIKEHIREELNQIYSTGWSIPFMPAISKRRETLGLPAAPRSSVHEVQSIIIMMGLDKFIGERKERGVDG